jgi:HK97 family phage portal protein
VGFLERIIRGAEFRSSTLATPADWLIDALVGARTTSGEKVTVKNALGMIAVFAAVSKISEEVGSKPLKVYRAVAEGKEEAPEHRAWRMLHDAPNPFMPAHRFWSTVTGNVLLWGNAFVAKQRDEQTSLVDTLWLLDPARMSIEWSEVQGIKRFKYTLQTGERRTLTEAEVIHIMDYSLDGIVGESRISRCREGIGTGLARRRFESRFFQRGTVMPGVIEHPGHLRNTRPLRESWTEIYGGADSAHQVGVLEEGATWKSVSMPLKDMEFVESAKLSNTEIAILFNLPPSYLGGSTGDSLTYATVEGNAIQLQTQTIAPITTNIAKTLEQDRGVFPFPSWWPEFELKAAMRGDSQARAAYLEKAGDPKTGWMNRNERRETEGLPPDDVEAEQKDAADAALAALPIGDAVDNALNGSTPKAIEA